MSFQKQFRKRFHEEIEPQIPKNSAWRRAKAWRRPQNTMIFPNNVLENPPLLAQISANKGGFSNTLSFVKSQNFLAAAFGGRGMYVMSSVSVYI